MEQLLPALLRHLQQRSLTLRDRVATLPSDEDVQDHALGAYQLLETVRRGVVDLLGDPSLGITALLPNHLQEYKRLSEFTQLVEAYYMPFLERYSESDRRLTRLCRRMLEQAHWQLPMPLVATLSREYYWTNPLLGLICVPAAEGTSLLGLPDLSHEAGHILLVHHEAELLGDFLPVLVNYINGELARVDRNQRPPQYRDLIGSLGIQWQEGWLREFACDMIATYVTGPAFAWQHVRLCAGSMRSAFEPGLGEIAEHPADEARLRGVVAILNQTGRRSEGEQIRSQWNAYVSISPEAKPTDYDIAYPQALIEWLAACVVKGCRSLGLRECPGRDDPGGQADVHVLLNEAWHRFLVDLSTYALWERKALESLWRDLGFDRTV